MSSGVVTPHSGADSPAESEMQRLCTCVARTEISTNIWKFFTNVLGDLIAVSPEGAILREIKCTRPMLHKVWLQMLLNPTWKVRARYWLSPWVNKEDDVWASHVSLVTDE